LYHLEFSILDRHDQHYVTPNFGVRKFEIRDGAFHLNGERVRRMGVERMAGSNPEFGMAEPAEWIAHDRAAREVVWRRVHLRRQDRRSAPSATALRNYRFAR
jgi:beta-glucuronidase